MKIKTKTKLTKMLLFSGALGLFAFGGTFNANADGEKSVSSSTSSAVSSTSRTSDSSVASNSAASISSAVNSSSSSMNSASSTSSSSNTKVTYKITTVKNYVMRQINTSSARIWASPYTPGTSVKNKTTNMKGNLIKITQTARGSDGSLYYHISYQGKDLGWIYKRYLSYTDDYELPFVYTSQLYPIYAPSGCEAAAMKMALSTMGLALNTPLDKFINQIPKSADQNKGYVNDPFTKGAGATIYPSGMASFLNKNYTSNSKDITNTSLSNIVYNVKRGNSVVFEGSWRMIVNSKSDHVLIIVGYKPGYFLVADPYMRKGSANKVFWTKTSDFLTIWHNSKRGSRAAVVSQ